MVQHLRQAEMEFNSFPPVHCTQCPQDQSHLTYLLGMGWDGMGWDGMGGTMAHCCITNSKDCPLTNLLDLPS